MKLAILITLITTTFHCFADPGITIEVKVVIPDYVPEPEKGKIYGTTRPR